MNNRVIASLRKEAMIEYRWRKAEILFFEDQMKRFSKSTAGMIERDKYRKSLILVLYSHFEGYCKFMFQLYIDAINRERIKCKFASHQIVAATLDIEFKDLINPKKKSRVFPKVLTVEDALHPFARRAEFLEEIGNFMEKVVIIPDDVIDLESNLKPIVIRKNLYKLGLSHELFDSLEGEVSQLLTIRNGIAHGNFLQGVPQNRYKNVRTACFDIMNTLRIKILDALKSDEFKRP